MISGRVIAGREATIEVVLRAYDGHLSTVPAVIDTGFDGYLSLSPDTVAALGLRRFGSAAAELGDGSTVEFPAYFVELKWDSRSRRVEVIASHGGAMIGMAMLAGCDLLIEVIPDGAVSIRQRE